MTLVVTHTTVTGAAADTTALVDGTDWDANHTLTGVVSASQGGTGIVNNDASTITITGSFGITFTISAATSLTFPTTGTVATLAGTEALTNKTYNKVTITAPATSATLTLVDGTTVTGPAATGTLATLAGSETLTNKTVALGSNTVSGTTAQFNTALSDGDFATLAGTEALTNKTIGNTNTVTLKDTLFTLQDNADTTKQFNFQLSAISAGTTRTWTVPNVDDAFLGQAATQNVTNKILDNSNTIAARDDRFTLQDSADATKQAVFQLSGITTATTRTLTVPNADGTLLYASGPLGTPASGVGTNLTGIPISTGLTGAGTGVLTALAVNVGSAGAFVTFNGALGTPSSGVGTNITGVNAATLGGATFAAPGAIGGSTPAAGNFTAVDATSTVRGTGLIADGSLASVWSLDTTPTTITIGAGATQALPTCNGGLLWLRDNTTSGASGLFILGNGLGNVVAQTGSLYSNAPGATVYLTYSASVFTINNGTAGSITFGIGGVKFT